ncbi:MAG: PAS domain-containing sensor histidine kinase [Ignavibacteriae bacterium]|nr:PAS domain-containing sensor histidine kinase [Ignavibacteriota bacterium]MCB9220943.1 PAS domain-containing sensor histidine kinase [Ignavibacteria bacterium]
MLIIRYLLLTAVFLPFILNAEVEENYPVLLDKNQSIPGVIYNLSGDRFISVKNNWLDKTTTLSIFNSNLDKRSLILNKTEIRDLYSEDSFNVAIAASNNRAFLTIFYPDFSVKKIHLLDTNIGLNDKFKILYSKSNKFIISRNNVLFYFDTKSKIKQTISTKYVENSFIMLESNEFYYLRASDNVTYLIENINHKYEKELLRVEPANSYTTSIINNKIVIECHYEKNSHIFIYSRKLKLLNEFWVDVESNNYLIEETENNKLGLYTIDYSDNQYIVKLSDFKDEVLRQFDLPSYITSPLGIFYNRDNITVLFQNAIYNFDLKLNVNFYKPISITTNELNSNISVLDNEKYFAYSTTNTHIFSKQKNTFWQIYSYYNSFINYIVPLSLFIVIIIIYYLYLKKKELNETLLELSDNDFIFVFNKKGDLVNLNKTAMNLIEIDSSVPLGRFYKYYCISEHTKELFEIFLKMRELKENFQQKIHIFQNNELHEYICNAVTKRRSTGSIVGYLLSGTDITEELRQQKLNNFAQLAHDMQTNLSTLKLNAEELETQNEDSALKKLKIIKQINILNQKVRDIVTVGRSSNVHKAKHNAKDLISDVIEEFDLEMFPNITFIDEGNSFELYVDKQKLSRAIRNATENSLKSMNDRIDGKLILRSYKNSKYAYFEVEDNGRGMSKEVKENMLKPYFTSAGGTGLGTMIMRNAIEQHGGEIIVESEEGKGTKISFKIPLT